MNPRLLVALMLLIGGTALSAPLPFPKPAKKQVKLPLPEAIQGLWQIKSRTMAGGTKLAVSTAQQYVKIEGTTWTYLRSDKTPGTQCEMTLTPGTKPAQLDLGFPNLAAAAGGGVAVARLAIAGPYMVGIVEVDGGAMKFCYTLRGERPASFDPVNPREYLFTLERVPPEDVRKKK